MKTNMDDLDLRDAFPPMPEACHDALMRAARSVREEKTMKRSIYRTILIAALILAGTMAVAAAAGGIFGWNDFFSTYHSETTIPQGAQEILNTTEERVFTLGPITYKVQQLYADHYTALASVQITAADDTLLCMDSCQLDPIGANGDNWIRQAERLGVSPDLTWVEAAKQLGRPLYSVRCILNAQAPYDGGECMEDTLYDADGHLINFSMQMLSGDARIRTLPIQMFVRAAEIDPATGEEKSVLTDRPTFDLPVAQPPGRRASAGSVYGCRSAFRASRGQGIGPWCGPGGICLQRIPCYDPAAKLLKKNQTGNLVLHEYAAGQFLYFPGRNRFDGGYVFLVGPDAAEGEHARHDLCG